MATVRMIHPGLPGRVAEVPEISVPTHRRAGWEVAPPEPEPQPPAAEDAPNKPRSKRAASAGASDTTPAEESDD